jgi:uncharacterized membrane protein YccC
MPADQFIKERISFIELGFRLREAQINLENMKLPAAIEAADAPASFSPRSIRLPGKPSDYVKQYNAATNNSAPLVMYALIRALVIAGTFALAFGLDLSHGYWLPIAAIVAMKPSLEQSTLVGVQRLAGALIGAAAAALLLLIPANEHGLHLVAITHGLQVVALVLFMHAAGIRFWNYALYCGAIAAGVLILLDLPQPSNYGAEGYRVLWTLCGVGIGVLVMFLAGLLAKRAAKAPPQQAAQPA